VRPKLMQSVIFGSFGGESVISGSLVSSANCKEGFEGGYEVRFFVLLLYRDLAFSCFFLVHYLLSHARKSKSKRILISYAHNGFPIMGFGRSGVLSSQNSGLGRPSSANSSNPFGFSRNCSCVKGYASRVRKKKELGSGERNEDFFINIYVC
jgi:hypothetical protein